MADLSESVEADQDRSAAANFRSPHHSANLGWLEVGQDLQLLLQNIQDLNFYFLFILEFARYFYLKTTKDINKKIFTLAVKSFGSTIKKVYYGISKIKSHVAYFFM